MAPAYRVVARDAEISPDGAYRWRLSRTLAVGFGRVVWVMLNPSTADSAVDDPTVRRCVGFSAVWGFSEVVVVNLFALRATDPAALRAHPDPVGPLNDANIWAACDPAEARCVVMAWGTHGRLQGRGLAVEEGLRRRGAPRLSALGWTRGGEPRHPLYMRADARPLPLEARLGVAERRS